VGSCEHGNELRVRNFPPPELQPTKDCTMGVDGWFKELQNIFLFLDLSLQEECFLLEHHCVQSCTNFVAFCRNSQPTALRGK